MPTSGAGKYRQDPQNVALEAPQLEASTTTGHHLPSEVQPPRGSR